MLDKPATQSATRTSGPLAGFRIVEFAGIGPGPFACMMLADMGAEVVTLDRVGAKKNLKSVAGRGRKVVELDLKDKAAVAQVLDLLANADALIEGFRPGVMERLGLGPDVVMARNPRLVFGRMTGWGQEGPLAQAAGHDINYISVTGALAAIGTKEKPVPPLNLVGDFGGGALYLVVGVLAALLEASKSGKGQVVDAAMCDGAASLMSMFFDMTAIGRWVEGREQNFLDGGAHFYGIYECSCGNFISIGSIEPQFYALLREHAGLTDADFDAQMDRKAWPALKEKLTKVFKSKTPRGLVQDHGRHRHLLRADPDHGRSAEASAQRRAQDLRRAPRRDAARAGAAVFADAVGDQGCGEGGYRGTDERVEGGKVDLDVRTGGPKARLRRAHHQLLGKQWWARCALPDPTRSLRRVAHLQHTPANLIFLDRFEQRLEIALAETIVALALDEFEEDRPDRVRREDLQQHLGVAAIDDALAVDQNAVALQAGDVLAMLRQPRVDLLEIGIGRRRHERQSASRSVSTVAIDVPRAAGDVLDALAAIDVEIFLDLPGIAGVLVDRDPDLAVRAGQRAREQARMRGPRCRRSGSGGS